MLVCLKNYITDCEGNVRALFLKMFY